MPYDRPDYSHYGRGEYGPAYEEPRTPYGTVYTRPSHGYETGYDGGTLRSRGSYGWAPMSPTRISPRGEEFRWGGGYVGGRGYGGTNYDLEHGYRTGGRAVSRRLERGVSPGSAGRRTAGYDWDRPGQTGSRVGGPARYGYGPYHERLRRRRRSDEEIEDDVREALFYDTWVDADRIRIGVDEGVVTLEATLPDFDEVRYATDDAWDVDGVRGVRTELDVEATPATDRLGRQREFTAGQVAEANEAGAGTGGQARTTRGSPGAVPRLGGRTAPRTGGTGLGRGERATPGIGAGPRTNQPASRRTGGTDPRMGEHLAPRLGPKTAAPAKGERLKPRPGGATSQRSGSAESQPAGGGEAGQQTRGTERSAGRWHDSTPTQEGENSTSEATGESTEGRE